MSTWSYMRGSNQNLKTSKNYLDVYLNTRAKTMETHSDTEN